MAGGKYNPKSLQNLRPVTETMTPAQRLEGCSLGGRARAENMRKRRLFSDIIAEIGQKKLSKRRMSENVKAMAEMYGITGDISGDVGVILAQYAKATEGDTDAARFIRDTSGQSPAQMVRVGTLDAQSADLSQVPDDVLQAEIAALEAGSE